TSPRPAYVQCVLPYTTHFRSTVIEVSAAQLTQTSFVTGGVSDLLQIRAFDGFGWSAGENASWAPFTVTVPVNHAPVLTTANVSKIGFAHVWTPVMYAFSLSGY